MERDIAVYSFRVAQNLIREGYKLKNMELNSKIRNKLVFYFEKSEDIKKELLEKHNIDIV